MPAGLTIDVGLRAYAWTRVRRLVEPALGIAGVLLLWSVLSRHVANANLLPSPTAVWRAFTAMLDDELPTDIGASMVHLGVGYGAGASVGLLLALLAASSQWVEALVDPAVDSCVPLPRLHGSRLRS